MEHQRKIVSYISPCQSPRLLALWYLGTLRTTSSVTEGNNNNDNNKKPTKLSLCLGDLFTT